MTKASNQQMRDNVEPVTNQLKEKAEEGEALMLIRKELDKTQLLLNATIDELSNLTIRANTAEAENQLLVANVKAVEKKLEDTNNKLKVCGICFTLLEEQVIALKNCGHTLCSKCAKGIMRASGNDQGIECPFCRSQPAEWLNIFI